jgi:hypothetical protein
VTYYKEESRQIPIVGEYDVVVIGGGLAGSTAALAAAQTGAETLLVERSGTLGGMMTHGLMPWPYAFGDGRKIIAPGVPIQILRRLRDEGGLCGNPREDQMMLVDIEIAKYVFDQLVQEENRLHLLLETWVVDVIAGDGRVKGIIIENKTGRQAILAKALVDCSGDADVVARSGGAYELPPKETLHPVSIVAKLANVDTETVNAHNPQKIPFPGLLKGRSYPRSGLFIWKPFWQVQEADQKTPWWADWFIYLGPTTREHELIIIITGEIAVDATNGAELTQAEIVSRGRLQEIVKQLNARTPGFGSAYITGTSSMLGVRETRRIIGEYTLTKEDILTQKSFSDTAAHGCVPPGPHTPDGRDIAQPVHIHLEPYSSFQIPFRCLIPKEIEGVLAAGRCISVEQSALGAVRVQGTCMATGQAAGVGAALAARENLSPRQLPIDQVKLSLQKLADQWTWE